MGGEPISTFADKFAQEQSTHLMRMILTCLLRHHFEDPHCGLGRSRFLQDSFTRRRIRARQGARRRRRDPNSRVRFSLIDCNSWKMSEGLQRRLIDIGTKVQFLPIGSPPSPRRASHGRRRPDGARHHVSYGRRFVSFTPGVAGMSLGYSPRMISCRQSLCRASCTRDAAG
jgi:hypothetical protein